MNQQMNQGTGTEFWESHSFFKADLTLTSIYHLQAVYKHVITSL